MARKLVDEYIHQYHTLDIYVPTRSIWLGHGEDGSNGIDFTSASRAIKNLHILDSLNQDPITLYLNTCGGDEYQGMAIYDRIKATKAHVTIIGTGEVCSMGAYILQAADIRMLAPNCIFMMHIGTSNVDGDAQGHRRITRNWIDFEEKYGRIINDVLLSRIREKNPDFSQAQFNRINLFDTILLPQEVVGLGLADKVVEL